MKITHFKTTLVDVSLEKPIAMAIQLALQSTGLTKCTLCNTISTNK